MEASSESPSPEVLADGALAEVLQNEIVKIGDLRRNRNAPTHYEGIYRYEDLKTIGPVVCDWSLALEAAGFVVHGNLQANVELECVRCLAPVVIPVALQIDERFVFDSFVDRSEKEKELLSDDFYEVVDEEGELDLKDLAHQWLLLESENHPLCGRAECQF